MWKVQLLGGLAAHSSNRNVTRFRTQKAASLLGYLAYHRAPQPREALVAMLWPDAEDDVGRHNLSNALSFLRHLLEPTGVPAGSVIVADRYTVQLNPATVSTDVEAFEACLAGVGPDEPSVEDRIACAEQAAEIYRGPLLPGVYEDWTAPEALRLEELFARCLIQLSELLIEVGRADRAVKYAQRAVAIDPIDEDATVCLIKAMAALGQTATAMRAYRTYERRLEEELNAEPSDRLKAVLRELGKGGPSRSEPMLCTAERPHGEQGESTPIAARGSTGTIRSTASRRLLGGEFLLRTASRFFDREDEVERLGQMLSTSRTRLVTLTGPGGTGKTRLAVEAAARIVVSGNHLDSPPTAAVFVSLAEISDSARLYDVILRAVGGVPTPGQDELRQLSQVLEAQSGTLLVLDNFEHLVDDGALKVQEILANVAGVKSLVTSRLKLGIEAEREFHLSALPTSGGETSQEALMSVPSIALFVDRAESVLADFQLTPRNVDAVCQLCDYLEGLPLAIELAAARVVVLSPARILEQVQANRLDFLAARRRGHSSRQRTLRATLDWSYQLLSDAGQTFLRQVSVFRGGWTFEAARAVSNRNETDTFDLLMLLCDSSLISVLDTQDGPRFTMLETIREYAGDLLAEKGEQDAVSRRHRDYFLEFAEVAESKLFGGEQTLWLDRLETDHENLLAALSRHHHEPSSTDASLRLAAALGRFWQVHAHLAEGRARLGEALARDSTGVPSRLRARALASAGVLALDQADHQSAKSLFDESLAISEDLEDMPGIARSFAHLGNLARDQDRDADARVLYEKSLEIYRGLADNRGTATALHGLGIIALHENEYETSKTLCTESLDAFRKLGDKQEVAWLLFQLGNVAREQVDYKAARNLQEESLTVFQELRDIQGISKVLYSLGFVAREQGEYGAARAYLEHGLELCRDLGDRRGIAIARHQLGILEKCEGKYGEAAATFDQNLRLLRELKDFAGIGWSLLEEARTNVLRGEYEAARALYEEGLTVWDELGKQLGCADTWGRVGWPSHTVWREFGQKLGRGLTLHELGNLASEQADFCAAKKFYEQGLAEFEALGKNDCIASSLQGLAKVAEYRAEYSVAISLYKRSLCLLCGLRDKHGIANVMQALSRVSMAIGLPDRAVTVLAAARRQFYGADTRGPGKELEEHDLVLVQARDALTSERFRSAWVEGSALSPDQVSDLFPP